MLSRWQRSFLEGIVLLFSLDVAILFEVEFLLTDTLCYRGGGLPITNVNEYIVILKHLSVYVASC